ncbi:MAG: RNA 2'-phosphotransferase [Proteobacteria bacterium]|nr:RNA 2'-phosphotransferase [Pseudomonadota bacterium]
MDISRSREKLNSFLGYILGRSPYEFGLVPDDNGFVKIKDLLKAIREEDGFRHVTSSSLDELMVTVKNPLLDIQGDLIRARDRDQLPLPSLEQGIPKLLFIGIRTRAHGHVMNKGLAPNEDQAYVILCSDRDLAERIGKRRDPEPVIITVNTHKAEDLGVLFLFAGQHIYLARSIPIGCFSGPPLSSTDDDRSKPKKNKAIDKRVAPTPGSFFPDIGETFSNAPHKTGKQDKLSWKHNKKKIRKQKETFRGDY